MSEAEETGGEQRALNLLGIALRGGHLEVGTTSVKESARRGALAGAVLAADAGENARDRVLPLLRATDVPVAEAADGHSLGAALGRDRTVIVGVTDDGLAREVMDALTGESERDAIDADGS